MEIYPAQGASSRDVEEPGVDAFGVEAVVAGEHALVLAGFEVLGADAAAGIVGVVGLGGAAGAG